MGDEWELGGGVGHGAWMEDGDGTQQWLNTNHFKFISLEMLARALPKESGAN